MSQLSDSRLNIATPARPTASNSEDEVSEADHVSLTVANLAKEKVDLIAFDTITVTSTTETDTILSTAKANLRREADNITTLEHVGERLACGNRAGTDLLTMLSEKIEAQTRLEQTVASNTAEISTLKQTVRAHERQITDLKSASEGFLDIRERFVDVFRWDVLRRRAQGPRTTDAVRRGNERAHHGDAIGDALLFELRGRSDLIVYTQIYGLSLPQVKQLGKYVPLLGGVNR